MITLLLELYRRPLVSSRVYCSPCETVLMQARALERHGLAETSWSFYRLRVTLTPKGELIAARL